MNAELFDKITNANAKALLQVSIFCSSLALATMNLLIAAIAVAFLILAAINFVSELWSNSKEKRAKLENESKVTERIITMTRLEAKIFNIFLIFGVSKKNFPVPEWLMPALDKLHAEGIITSKVLVKAVTMPGRKPSLVHYYECTLSEIYFQTVVRYTLGIKTLAKSDPTTIGQENIILALSA